MRPIRLSRRLEPFDSDQFIFELKVDGFRALAHIDAGEGQLTSRNGNVFHGFAELATWIAEHLRVESPVLDGEIACVDEGGRPVFRDLLFRRRQCVFIAFDLLYLNGKDLRTLPLIERKTMLKELLRRSVHGFFISITWKVTADCA
jgi:bifunctional non-homologous end joining protein LigD